MTAALTATGVSKTFGGQRALADLELSIEPGEVRALVGQNGCGKSTFIKILAGFHLPDDGAKVEVGGRPLGFGDGSHSEAAGLRFVHQDLGLVGSLDTVDNLSLGLGYATQLGTIRWRAERARAQAALAALGYDFDVRAPVGSLAMSERTAVAVARALSPRGTAPTLLILDEPTANLPAAEAQRLYQLVRRVADSGIAVMFVSHHFDEVFELADSVTVLRDGRHIVTRPVEGLTEDGLIELVVGRSIEEFHTDADAAARGPQVLQLDGVGGARIADLSLTLHAGEIVGIAGITGSGREEVAGVVFGGLDRTGTITIGARAVPALRPDLSLAAGMGLVPAERHVNAALLTATLRENVAVVEPGRHWKGLFLRHRSERSDIQEWLTRLDVRPADSEFLMSSLSGGNQQKVVLARWLRKKPTVLVLDEPTQGVDVGAKTDIHRLVDEAAAQGTGVLVASTDHDELVRLCHRVLVLRRGRVVDELAGSRLTRDGITAVTIGRDQVPAA